MAQGFACVAMLMASLPTARAIKVAWSGRHTQQSTAVCPTAVEFVDPAGQARLACGDALEALGCPPGTVVAAGDRVELITIPQHRASVACRVRPDGMRAAWMLTWGYALDINRRSAQELAYVPGISAALAERVAAHRAQAGDFASLEGLLAVRGIGRKSLEKLRPYLKAGAIAG